MKLYESVLREASKKYDKELWDIAEERTANDISLPCYVGILNSGKSFGAAKPEDVTWMYVSEEANLDKERRESEIEMSRGVMKCDEFGNVLPKEKQVKMFTRDGKPIYGSGFRIDKKDKVLIVKRRGDFEYDANGNMKYSGRGKDKYAKYKYYEPEGKPGAAQRRADQYAKENSEEEKRTRWAGRGRVYSPWNPDVKHWPEKFMAVVNDWRNGKFTGKYRDEAVGALSRTDLLAKGERFGIDPDEIDQYLSEADGAYLEARRYSAQYGG